MMSLQSKLRQLYEPFAERLPCPVTHYRRVATFPFAVWAEDGESNSFAADDHKQEQKIAGYIDYFTKSEWDANVDLIQEILDDEGVAWALASVDYEEDTNLIHFRWSWEVV